MALPAYPLADLGFVRGGVTLGTRASEAFERSVRASIEGVWADGKIKFERFEL